MNLTLDDLVDLFCAEGDAYDPHEIQKFRREAKKIIADCRRRKTAKEK